MTSISIVTPTLNRKDLLRRTLESVASQELHELEHVVVDGASDDGTQDLLWDWRERVTSLRENGSGPAEAVNKGLRRCSGEVIGCLNSDDVYYPGAVQRVLNVFAARPEVDVVYGRADYIDDDNDAISPVRVKPWSRRRLRQKVFLSQPAVFFRRRLLERFGFLDERLRCWAHYEFWLRCADGGAVFRFLPETLAGCRIHERNHFLGNSDRKVSLAAAREGVMMLAEKYGQVPHRWLLNYARIFTELRGLDRVSSARYDWSVLICATRMARRTGTRRRSLAATAVRLLARHSTRELEYMMRNPHCISRFLPRPLRQFIQTHLRRRIFKLRHHAPKHLSLPASYFSTSNLQTAPRISIVTPNLNHGEYLEATIGSVLNQDYPHIEYIIQDGGSTDSSVEVMKRHEKQLAGWRSMPDRGQAHAINLGMRQTTGEVMAYLNSNDLLLTGSLSYVAQYFQDHPDVDVVYGHRILVDERGAEIGRWVLPPHDDKVIPFADYIPQETMFWRRSAWDKVGGQLDESFRFAMDWDLILRFRQAGLRFVRLPRFLGAFRVLDDQKTTQLIRTVGRLEMNRLRLRTLGHVPTCRELRRVLKGYLRRQWLLDKLYLLRLARY